MQTEVDVFVIDVLKEVCLAMQVAKPDIVPTEYFTINFEPGLPTQIINSLKEKDGTSYEGLKYPLIAVQMPYQEDLGSGFLLEVTFPRIVFAYLTKTGTGTEKVKDKYDSAGIFKTILKPCVNEFIKRLAWSKYTSYGDPNVYQYTQRFYPSVQRVGDGLTDFVDIIELLNLKTLFFNSIKSC